MTDGLSVSIAEDAVGRVLRERYAKGDRWAVELPLGLMTDGSVSREGQWRFTADQVLVDASGALYVEPEPGCAVRMYLAPTEWLRAVRL